MNTGSLFARASLANTLAIQPRHDRHALRSERACSPARTRRRRRRSSTSLADRLNVATRPDGLRAAWIDYMNRNDDGSLGTWTNTSGNVDKKVRGLVHVMLTGPAFQLA